MAADAKTLAWMTLSLTQGIGPGSMRLLLDAFGDPARILAASPQELATVPGLRRSTAEALRQPPRGEAERECSRATGQGIAILPWDHPAYPPLLRQIYDPPLVLYVRGRAELLGKAGLGVVGARAATAYGQQIAETFAFQLASRGLVIISGFALGIDAAAHAGALQAGGDTIAVLGSGLDVVYPSQNRKLFEKILETGTLVSEYPLGTKPDAFRFPARNRIISGLALGVLVVEAAKHSGSLITARQALEQGREVFAIPGRVDSWKSEGTHRLLQEGAKLVHSVEDILEELATGSAPAALRTSASGAEILDSEEEQLFALVDVYPKTIDELIRQVNLPAGKVTELLLMLELKQRIISLPGKLYQRKT